MNINKVVEGSSKKDTIAQVLKILSAVYLAMNIYRLGKELTKKDKEKR